jgi:hypothetical protein
MAIGGLEPWQAIGLFVCALGVRVLLKGVLGDVTVPIAMLLFGAMYFMKPNAKPAAAQEQAAAGGLDYGVPQLDDHHHRRSGRARLGGRSSLSSSRSSLSSGRSSLGASGSVRSLNRRVGQGWADARTGFGNPR